MPFSRSKFSGFPFEDDSGRDSRDQSFTTQLEDIAKRHPEFAEHLGPFRSNSWGRRPQESDGDFSRFQNRRDIPFGSRFEQFGFPFVGDPFNEVPEFSTPENFSRPQAQAQARSQAPHSQNQPQPQSYSQSFAPEAQYSNQENSQQTSNSQEGINTEDNSQKPPLVPERGRKPQTIQQSNTVDLGQKQEPVNERNQRSMSAPPPENRPNQRFVSSINIPIQRGSGGSDMGGQQSQPQQYSSQHQPQPASNKPMERVIPIHVEGRDEPVMPRNPSFTPQQPQPSQGQGYHQQHPTYQQPPPYQQPPTYQQPQPETIFGHRPSHFTQFINRDSPSRGFSPADDLIKQQHDYQRQQQDRFKQQPPKQQPAREVPIQPQNAQQQEAAPPQPSAPPQQSQKLTPIDQIQAIQKDVSELMLRVENFAGQPRDKQYIYLDEMLTRNLLKLDNIDTQGQENIRAARKAAIKCIESCIGVLESKAAANVPQSENKTEEKSEVTEHPMETELVKSGSTAEIPKPESVADMKTVDEKMEVVPEGTVPQTDKQPEIEAVSNTVENKVETATDEVNSAQAAEVSADQNPEGTKPEVELETNKDESNKNDPKEENTDKKEKKKGKKKNEKAEKK